MSIRFFDNLFTHKPEPENYEARQQAIQQKLAQLRALYPQLVGYNFSRNDLDNPLRVLQNYENFFILCNSILDQINLNCFSRELNEITQKLIYDLLHYKGYYTKLDGSNLSLREHIRILDAIQIRLTPNILQQRPNFIFDYKQRFDEQVPNFHFDYKNNYEVLNEAHLSAVSSAIFSAFWLALGIFTFVYFPPICIFTIAWLLSAVLFSYPSIKSIYTYSELRKYTAEKQKITEDIAQFNAITQRELIDPEIGIDLNNQEVEPSLGNEAFDPSYEEDNHDLEISGLG